MAKRDLKDTVENQYFKRESIPVAGEEGTREMNPLLPFIISGGKNTERYYFKHISHITPFKFNIKPEYFGDESQYNVRFSEIVDEILRGNGEDSRIFCVFDLDTIIGNKTRENSLKEFEKRVKVWGLKRKVHYRKYILPIFSLLYELPKKRNVHFALI